MRHGTRLRAAIAIAATAVALGGAISCAMLRSTDEPSGSAAAARVGGVEITVAELDESLQGEILRMEVDHRRAIYRTRQNGLRFLIDDELIEAEAARRGITPKDLFETEVAGPAQDVSDEDLRELYDHNRERLEGSYQELRDKLRDYWVRQQYEQNKLSLLARLHEEAEIDVLLPYPDLPVVAVPGGATSPSRGPEGAPVTIVEFSDFQCPFCDRVRPSLLALLEDYPEELRLVYRHFPLSAHPLASPAAEASACAGEQERFWTYHDLVFENQAELSEEKLFEFANTAALDLEIFRVCFEEGRYQEQVRADYRAGLEAGVRGTPAFFVNGRPLSGADAESDLRLMIERELARVER